MIWRLVCPTLAVCFLTVAGPRARSDEPLDRLLEKRLRVAQDTYEAHWKLFLQGRQEADLREVYHWSVRFLKSEQAVAPTVGGKVRALVTHRQRMADLEAIAKLQFEAGRLLRPRYTATVFYRLEAEVWIAEAKAKEKTNP